MFARLLQPIRTTSTDGSMLVPWDHARDLCSARVWPLHVGLKPESKEAEEEESKEGKGVCIASPTVTIVP